MFLAGSTLLAVIVLANHPSYRLYGLLGALPASMYGVLVVRRAYAAIDPGWMYSRQNAITQADGS